MPVDYSKYPPNWFTEIRPRILKRANDKCEECGLPNYAYGYRERDGTFVEIVGAQFVLMAQHEGKKVIRIILTISHEDHDITNNEDENLKAKCQKCHLMHDKAFHSHTRTKNNAKRKGLTDIFKIDS